MVTKKTKEEERQEALFLLGAIGAGEDHHRRSVSHGAE